MARPGPVAASRLFSPLRLREHELPNRIVNTPHGTHLARDGVPTPEQIAYYEARAAGGAGMIVAGNWAVWRRTWTSPLVNLATHPKAHDGHVALAAAVHRHGAVLVGQLHDSGRQGNSAWHRGPLLAPSAIADPVVAEVPKELETHEIAEMVRSYADSAAALCSAGWDGVEIFAAQGYALSQFLSPQNNLRDDRYGGPVRDRLRVVLDVLDAVRDAIGPGPLVGVRINATDLVAGGLDPTAAAEVATALDGTGSVDYLSVSAGSNENYPAWIADMGHPVAPFAEYAAALRARISMPVLVATRIKTFEAAEGVLASGQADLVGMTRALIADPDLPRKLRTGREAEVRPCIGCNQGCLGRIAAGGALSCTVNPRAGKETLPVPAVRHRRDVLVVGGGPAGLQAAVTLAERGHAVSLWESEPRFGGQLALAASVPSRRELGSILVWLEERATALGVRLHRGREATAREIREHEAEVIVLAVGSEPVCTGYTSAFPARRALPGHDLPQVWTVPEVLSGAAGVESRVLVLDDDPHGQATTAAEYLGARGHQVDLVTRRFAAGTWAGPVNAHPLHTRLADAGVEITTLAWAERIGDGFVDLAAVYGDRRWRLEGVGSVVLATGNRARTEVYEELVQAGEPRPLIRIGDCLAPRRLDHAFWDATTLDVPGAVSRPGCPTVPDDQAEP
ncbi:oxidoreductase [Amycolatopsis thermoflava]|uniref:oxidoreductase n=1 Tax=Amycolatopsis thermoflava TaxID=84480 RepID=UPI003655E503